MDRYTYFKAFWFDLPVCPSFFILWTLFRYYSRGVGGAFVFG